jgi:hypothetical protein
VTRKDDGVPGDQSSAQEAGFFEQHARHAVAVEVMFSGRNTPCLKQGKERSPIVGRI